MIDLRNCPWLNFGLFNLNKTDFFRIVHDLVSSSVKIQRLRITHMENSTKKNVIGFMVMDNNNGSVIAALYVLSQYLVDEQSHFIGIYLKFSRAHFVEAHLSLRFNLD